MQFTGSAATLTPFLTIAINHLMSFLKRATPWLITLFLGCACYVAAYYWFYKPRYGHHNFRTKGLAHMVFLPMTHLDYARVVKKRQREARVFCQGTWKGIGAFHDADNKHHQVTLVVTIDRENLTITSADHDAVSVGKSWKIQHFDHITQLQKDDWAPRTTPDLKAFSMPISSDYVFLPWFPFHDSAPPVTSTIGKDVRLERVAP